MLKEATESKFAMVMCSHKIQRNNYSSKSNVNLYNGKRGKKNPLIESKDENEKINFYCLLFF